MKLQIALDIDKKKAVNLIKDVHDDVDIIEIGTPLVKQEGLGVVNEFKKYNKPIVADLKTMDTGFLEAEMAFKAGANISTVCGCADNNTIKGAIKAGKKYNQKVLVDLISVPNKEVSKRTKEILKMKPGPDYLCVHTGIDVQEKGGSPFSDLKKVCRIVKGMKRNTKKPKIAVAGGLNLKNINKIKDFEDEVDIVIIGSAITKAKNPSRIIKLLRANLQ
ncbi:3-hexulose-6-phosphate synthase [Candidatus Pacearchaeota archaeon]|nr:3-hexulose-6-phosphate synthase [Candidatus Pacearchaeota archaeon]